MFLMVRIFEEICSNWLFENQKPKSLKKKGLKILPETMFGKKIYKYKDLNCPIGQRKLEKPGWSGNKEMN